MKKIILFLSLFFSLSYGAITLKTVTFTDQEQNASAYLVSYYPYQSFIDLQLTSTQVGYIMTCRNNNTAQASMLSCASSAGLTTANLMRIREASYLIDWSLVTNALGINQRAYTTIMGLMGALIGFIVAFFLIYTVVNISRNKV
ncbi:MAG: hypothetical protein PHX13_12495 [Thiovulaceae bacterium]|nr:hypothetical protein [Sulfurimonadaceae bacterium]